MPIYHPIQGNLINRNDFLAEAAKLRAATFAVGSVSSATDVRPFVDVAYGKPLSVLVRWIYTGKYPEKRLFSSDKPMLLSSAIKDVTTTSAAAAAVNILKNRVSRHSAFSGPGAQEEGTNLLYFSPAVASPFITVTVSLVFEDFPKELFDKLGQLFTNLASVPVFMPAAGYLLAASSVVKLGGDIGSGLLNGHPVLNENLPLDFNFGGGSIPKRGYWILSGNAIDTGRYKFDVNQGLIDTGGHVYDAADPSGGTESGRHTPTCAGELHSPARKRELAGSFLQPEGGK